MYNDMNQECWDIMQTDADRSFSESIRLSCDVHMGI
jgi:hypothetical protein